MNKKYNAAVIGSGPAGYMAALKLAGAGKKTVLVEKKEEDAGGTCLNRGCIPVKSLIEASLLYRKMNEASAFGLDCRVSRPDAEKVIRGVQENIVNLKKGLFYRMKSAGIDIKYQPAGFRNENQIELEGGEVLGFDNALIATGSAPGALKGISYDGNSIINSSHILNMRNFPEKMLIVGGGYIGCEMATAFSAFGVEVTLIEYEGAILPKEDRDVSKEVEKAFRKKKIKINTQTILAGADLKGEEVEIERETRGKMIKENYDKVLIAAGRKPYYEGLNPENAGVATEGGAIVTDEKMQTSSKGIYAAGDVRGKEMFAHAAFRQGEIASSAILKKPFPEYQPAFIPRVIFSSPQAASAGMTLSQIRERDRDTFSRKVYFRANAKAVIEKETEGFMKLICDSESRKVLSACIVGPRACELIHSVLWVISSGKTIDALISQVYAHPTLSEIISDISI